MLTYPVWEIVFDKSSVIPLSFFTFYANFFLSMVIDLSNTRTVILLNIQLATINSVDYWSRVPFTELGGRISITESSHKSHIYTVQNKEGIPG